MLLLRYLAIYSVFLMFFSVIQNFRDTKLNFLTKLCTIIMFAPVIAVLLSAYISTFNK